MSFMETSAKTAMNVENAFMSVARLSVEYSHFESSGQSILASGRIAAAVTDTIVNCNSCN